eukprot:gene22454-27508_t
MGACCSSAESGGDNAAVPASEYYQPSGYEVWDTQSQQHRQQQQQQQDQQDQPTETEALLNMNSCTKKELIKLKGVGDVTASNIIAARPFNSVDEVLAVSSRRRNYSTTTNTNDNATSMHTVTPLAPTATTTVGTDSKLLTVGSWNIRSLSKSRDDAELQRI